VLGLLPMALGFGTGAEIQAPLARVVIGGLTATTLVTLILVPVAYVGMTNLRTRIAARRAPGAEATVDAEDRATA
jgi:hydrophobic/amphiphilic exporter-1 (mainly G- bacteria), HAE1 family